MKKKEAPSKVKAARVKRRDIDLIRALKFSQEQKVREKKRGRPGGLAYILGGAVVLAAAAGYALTAMQRAELTAENEDILTDISLMRQELSEATQLELKLDWLNALESDTAADISALADADGQYSYYARELFTRVRRQFMSGITIESIALKNDTLTLTLNANRASDAAELVKRLRNDGIFTEIQYTGFQSDDQEQITTFTITCGLTEGAVTGEDKQ